MRRPPAVGTCLFLVCATSRERVAIGVEGGVAVDLKFEGLVEVRVVDQPPCIMSCRFAKWFRVRRGWALVETGSSCVPPAQSVRSAKRCSRKRRSASDCTTSTARL
jgi:hypothetical protein